MEKKDKETILLVCPSLTIGGRERVAVNTFQVLKDLYDVRLVVFQRKTDEYATSADVICLDAYSEGSAAEKARMQFKRAKKIAKLCRELRPKAVVAFGEAANMAACLAKFFGARGIVSCIHGFGEVGSRKRMRLILSLSDKVVCISKAMQAALEQEYGKSQKLVTIENGYDIEQIQNNGNTCAEALTGNPKLIAMGRLVAVKGYDVMLRSLSALTREFPEAVLTVLGEGDQRRALEESAEKLGLAGRIRLLGNKENPYGYLKQADLLLLTSRHEGFPNVLIEALACGLPIVAVDCMSGPREILTGAYRAEETVSEYVFGTYGVLVEQKSDDPALSKCFADAVSELLRDREKLAEYRQKAPGRAKMFSLEVYRQKLLRLLTEM